MGEKGIATQNRYLRRAILDQVERERAPISAKADLLSAEKRRVLGASGRAVPAAFPAATSRKLRPSRFPGWPVRCDAPAALRVRQGCPAIRGWSQAGWLRPKAWPRAMAREWAEPAMTYPILAAFSGCWKPHWLFRQLRPQRIQRIQCLARRHFVGVQRLHRFHQQIGLARRLVLRGGAGGDGEQR